MNKQVLFIDDDDIERRSCGDVLREVFEGTPVTIEARAPLPFLADYGELVASGEVSAFILDEKLTTSNTVNYTGAELAEHLRAIGGSSPIVILTNFADEDFSARAWAFEFVVSKKTILRDPHSAEAKAFCARLNRQIDFSNGLQSEAEKRYHDLLIKSASTALSPEEDRELGHLEEKRIAPVAGAERERQRRLDIEIEKLKRLLGEGPIV